MWWQVIEADGGNWRPQLAQFLALYNNRAHSTTRQIPYDRYFNRPNLRSPFTPQLAHFHGILNRFGLQNLEADDARDAVLDQAADDEALASADDGAHDEDEASAVAHQQIQSVRPALAPAAALNVLPAIPPPAPEGSVPVGGEEPYLGYHPRAEVQFVPGCIVRCASLSRNHGRGTDKITTGHFLTGIVEAVKAAHLIIRFQGHARAVKRHKSDCELVADLSNSRLLPPSKKRASPSKDVGAQPKKPKASSLDDAESLAEADSISLADFGEPVSDSEIFDDDLCGDAYAVPTPAPAPASAPLPAPAASSVAAAAPAPAAPTAPNAGHRSQSHRSQSRVFDAVSQQLETPPPRDRGVPGARYASSYFWA